MTAEDLYDITVIGGGPSGLFGAYYAGFRALKTKVIDSLNELGGQITAFYPEKALYDVAGFTSIRGKDLVKNLAAQAAQYKPTVCLDERIRELTVSGEKEIKLVSDRGEHRTKVVLLTVGLGMFTPKKVPIPGSEAYEGKGLEYFVKSIEQLRGKRVLIIGGGDSAIDWVLNLLPVAKEITLIHRRDAFRAHEDSVRQVMSSPAHVKTFYELKSITGNGSVQGAVILQNKTNQEESLALDAIIACLGFNADLGPLANWGLKLSGRSVLVNSRMETNIAGIYAAGDLVAYPGKVRLIATGFGEAATAVNNAAAYINPRASVFPGHSSEKK